MISKRFVILCVCCAITAYILGCVIPLKCFLFDIDYSASKISQIEFVKIIISIIAAVLTLFAILVALFKERILSSINKPILSVELPTGKPIFEDVSRKMSVDRDEIIEAEKYISRLCVKNKGNVSATGVEFFLESLEFRALNSTIEEKFETSGDSLKWNNQKETINIPPGSEKVINIIEVFAPIKTATPDSDNVKENAKIIVGNYETQRKYSSGIWTATFTIYAQNHKHLNVRVKVEWKGKWKPRLTEFEGEYKYQIIKQ